MHYAAALHPTYTKINAGHMGQVVEWPEILTEGKDLEECRLMLKDPLYEMVLAYRQQNRELPPNPYLIESRFLSNGGN